MLQTLLLHSLLKSLFVCSYLLRAGWGTLWRTAISLLLRRLAILLLLTVLLLLLLLTVLLLRWVLTGRRRLLLSL